MQINVFTDQLEAAAVVVVVVVVAPERMGPSS